MLVRETGMTARTTYEPRPGAAWVAGAMAGISLVKSERAVDWVWSEFLDDVLYLINSWTDIRAVLPGQTPIDHEGREGSIYDALGGFISMSGTLEHEGLHFVVPTHNVERVFTLFPKMDLKQTGAGITVPITELQRFFRLVPIMGPLCDRCMEATM